MRTCPVCLEPTRECVCDLDEPYDEVAEDDSDEDESE